EALRCFGPGIQDQCAAAGQVPSIPGPDLPSRVARKRRGHRSANGPPNPPKDLVRRRVTDSGDVDNVVLQKSFPSLQPERIENQTRFAHRDPPAVKVALDLPFVIHPATAQHPEATDARQTKHEKIKGRRSLGKFLMPLFEAERVTACALPNPEAES